MNHLLHDNRLAAWSCGRFYAAGRNFDATSGRCFRPHAVGMIKMAAGFSADTVYRLQLRNPTNLILASVM